MRRKLFCVLAAALLIIGTAACSSMYGRTHEGDVVYEHDGSVRDDDGRGLDLKVLSFNWRYLGSADTIRVVGWVQNQTGKGLQGCRILVSALDQYDENLGTAETYLVPTYIGPEQKAQFDFFLPNGDWVTAIQLHYRFETRY